MKFFKHKTVSDDIPNKVLRRLRSVDNYELLRWTDNLIMGIGRDVDAIRKSLSSDPEQALAYIHEARQGAVSLLAAIQVLNERASESSHS